VDGGRIGGFGIMFDAEQKMRRDQHGLERELDALLETVALLLRHGNELDQAVHLMTRRGTAIGAMGQPR
jgi:hypothetical protein